MNARTRDRVGSIVALIFVGSLAVQRDYTTEFGGIFPDAVMVITVLLVVASLALSFTSGATVKGTGAEEKREGGPRWTVMAVVAAMLIAWAVLLPHVGFAVTGVVGFSAIAWYLARERSDPRVIVRSVVVGAAVTGALMVVFGQLLRVPLPRWNLF